MTYRVELRSPTGKPVALECVALDQLQSLVAGYRADNYTVDGVYKVVVSFVPLTADESGIV